MLSGKESDFIKYFDAIDLESYTINIYDFGV